MGTDYSHLRISTGTALGILIALVFGIISVSSPPDWLTVVLIIWVVLCCVAALFLSHVKRREKIVQQLEAPNYTQLYTYLCKGSVNWIWTRLCDPVNRKTGWHAYFRAALTWRLYDRALLVAAAYPIFLLVSQWVVTGATGRVGSFVVLQETDFLHMRAMFSAVILLIAMSFIADRRIEAIKEPREKTVGWPGVIAISIATAGATMFAAIGALSGALTGAFAVAITISVAVAVSFANHFAGTRAGASAVLGAFAGAGAVVGAGAGPGALEILLTALVAVTSTFVSALVVTVMDNLGRSRLARLLLTITVCSALIAFSGLRDWNLVPDNIRSLVLFLAMLPVFNPLFDVVSYAITLSLIRFGLRSPHPWLWGLVDLSLACLLFLGLGATLVAVIHGMNLLAGVPFIDLQTLFGGIHERPSDYWWLYLMLFSTILPTGLHIGISLISLQGICPRDLRHRLSGWIRQAPHSSFHGIAASLGLGALWAVPVAGTVGLIWLVVLFGNELLLWGMQWYFDLLLWLAAIPIGAI